MARKLVIPLGIASGTLSYSLSRDRRRKAQACLAATAGPEPAHSATAWPRQLQSGNLCSEEILSDLDVLARPAYVCRDEDIDEGLGTRRVLLVFHLDRDIG
jgi:hypothetical protein